MKTMQMEELKKGGTNMNKIVFFGGGQMGTGIMKGLIAAGVVSAGQIVVSEINPERRNFLEKELGVRVMEDASGELSGSDETVTPDIAVIAVNPYQLESVTDIMKGKVQPETIVLSIASGTPIAAIEEQLGPELKIVRVLPNTMIEVKTGYSAVTPNANITEEDREKIGEFVSALGQIMYIKEDMFQAFSAYAGPGPMYAYKLIESMINAGVQTGFSREDSRKIVIQNIKGAAMTLEKTGDHPAARVDLMTSPAGITIDGLEVLENGFAGIVMESIKVCVDKGERQ